jgi:hypothetical protein
MIFLKVIIVYVLQLGCLNSLNQNLDSLPKQRVCIRFSLHDHQTILCTARGREVGRGRRKGGNGTEGEKQ